MIPGLSLRRFPRLPHLAYLLTRRARPYTKACCYLSVGPNRIPYTVPTHYLKKSPRFSHQLVYYSGGRTIEEPELDEDIGHTLVHFLYTDEYQTLKRPILRKVEDEATEYRRSVLVYQTASKYELPLLMEHAKENIGKFDDAASVFEALDIAKVVYDKLQGGDEVWFYNYLKRKLKDAFDADEILFAQDKFIGFIDESPMFSRMLVKLVVEIYSDTLSRTRIENDQAEESDHHDRLLNESSELEYSEPATEDRPEPVVEEEPEPAPDEVPEPAPEEEPEEMPDWEPAAPEEAPLEPESAPEIEPVLEIEPEPELAVALSPVHDTGDFWPPRAMMKDKKKGGINGVFSSI